MYEAFESAGYDAKLVIGEGGHSGQHGGAIMPDILRWLWRDYPQPVRVHEPPQMSQPGWDPRGKVYSTVWADKGWQRVGGQYRDVGSPAADRDGNVYFTDSKANRIYTSGTDGSVTVFRENSGGAGSIAIGPDGTLFASREARGRIVSYSSGGEEKTVAQNVNASSIAVAASGSIYFTDSVHRSIGVVDARGRARVAYNGNEIGIPAGLALSADQAMLVVTDAQGRWSWSFQIAADGSLLNGEPFYRLEMPEAGWMSEVRGAAEDSLGQVYFATPLGIQICEANGRVAQILNPPQHGGVTSLAFGGKNLDWLYVAEGGNLFRRPTKVTSTGPWAPLELPKPPL